MEEINYRPNKVMETKAFIVCNLGGEKRGIEFTRLFQIIRSNELTRFHGSLAEKIPEVISFYSGGVWDIL